MGGSSQTENMRPFSLALSALKLGLFSGERLYWLMSLSGGDTMSGVPDSVVVRARRHREQALVCAWAPG